MDSNAEKRGNCYKSYKEATETNSKSQDTCTLLLQLALRWLPALASLSF